MVFLDQIEGIGIKGHDERRIDLVDLDPFLLRREKPFLIFRNLLADAGTHLGGCLFGKGQNQ